MKKLIISLLMSTISLGFTIQGLASSPQKKRVVLQLKPANPELNNPHIPGSRGQKLYLLTINIAINFAFSPSRRLLGKSGRLLIKN